MASKKEEPSTAARNRFHGKVAIVTGGASGIGLATVKRLASEGAAVAVFDINRDAGEKLIVDPDLKDFNISYYMVDVTQKDQCVQDVKAFAESNSGKLHYLVNCAAYFGLKGENAEKRDWDKSFSVNVVGYANMVQACIPLMEQTSGFKSIVNISSGSGYIAQPGGFWTYSSTKGAIHTMTKCMALDLAKKHIRVNSISPAWVWTPEIEKAAQGDRAKWEPVWKAYLMLERLCEAPEVASATCFLLSEDASFITGTDLRVDGGYCAMGPEGLGEKSVFAGSEY